MNILKICLDRNSPILGEKIGILHDALIDVSAEYGGGTVLVGGDFQGENTEVPNAEFNFVSPDAVIKVNAIRDGEGGKAIFWADNYTNFHGYVDARGGSEGGDGGFVEISGKETLHHEGLVNLLAEAGKNGTLLLDPESDLSIITGASVGGSFLTTPGQWTPSATTGTPSTIAVPDGISTQIALGNLVIQTSWAGPGSGPDNGSITLDSGGGTGPIFIAAPNANSLTFRSTGTGDILIRNFISHFGTGDINFFTAGGSVTIQASVLTLAGGAVNIGSPAEPIPNFILITPGTEGTVRVGSTGATGDLNIYGGDLTIRGASGSNASAGADTGTATIVTSSVTITNTSPGNISDTWTGIGLGSAANPPTVTPTPIVNITTTGNVNILGGNVIVFPVTGYRSYIEATTLTMDIGGDLIMTAGETVGSTADILSGLTDIDIVRDAILTGTANTLAFIDTTGSTNIQANRNVILNNQTRISATMDLTILAGVDMNLLGNASITGSTSVNLVVDNLFPVFPQLGTGAFSMEAGTVVTATGALRIFTSMQQLNSILGLLNGNAFAAGPLYQDTNSERWCIYFFDAFGGTPFTIFYKDCVIDAIQLYGADPFLALAEMYRMLHPYDEYIHLAMHFDVFYDREKYNQLQEAVEVFSSYDYIENQSFFIRLRNHNYTSYQYGSYIRDL